MLTKGPIGVFDSGYGGLTVLKEIVNQLPGYSYIYMGDNARAPYGPRSFETVYQYTLEAVEWFFKQGCPLVILACNTASAKALRTIQQRDLKAINSNKRVLGVIRPSTEVIGNFSVNGHIGILGTTGTVISNSYPIEIAKFFPSIKVYQEACPMWVPLIENNEHDSIGADYFVKKYLDQLMLQSAKIDTVLLACTHYPLLIRKIKEYFPESTKVISQGHIVATSLADYLFRHPEMEVRCNKESVLEFYTTDSAADFNKQAAIFFGSAVISNHLDLTLQIK